MNDIPLDLMNFVQDEADRDADRVGSVLRALELAGTPKNPRRVPQSLLLGLAAAFRLLEWEQNGNFVHRDYGLPRAKLLISIIVQWVLDAESDACLCVYRLVSSISITRFSWTARKLLNGDVIMNQPDVEAALNCLAELLWTNRH